MISIEGLPGCRKDEIYQALKEKHSLDVNRSDTKEWQELLVSNPEKWILAYQMNRLITLNYQYSGSGSLYDSMYSIKKVYVEYLLRQNTLTTQEYDVFMRYYNLMFKAPDVIIYFFGTFENTYRRMLEKSGSNHVSYSEEEFKQLHYQYEWVYDNNNCRIPIYKVNIDDKLDNILRNVVDIIEKTKNSVT